MSAERLAGGTAAGSAIARRPSTPWGETNPRKVNSMSRKMKSFCGISLLSLCLGLALGAAAHAAAAGEYNGKAKTSAGSKHKHKHKVKAKAPCRNPLHRLGVHRASRLYANAPLKTAAQLKKAFADKKFQQVVQRVFD